MKLDEPKDAGAAGNCDICACQQRVDAQVQVSFCAGWSGLRCCCSPPAFSEHGGESKQWVEHHQVCGQTRPA